jgi:hypothetical protein
VPIVLLSCFPQGNWDAKRSLVSVKGTNLRQRKRAISQSYLALVMALALVSRLVSAWGLQYNLSLYEAPEKAPPTASPAEPGFTKNRTLPDYQLHQVLPQETPLMGPIVGGQRVSGFVTIFRLTSAHRPTHFERARNEEIDLGLVEAIYA